MPEPNHPIDGQLVVLAGAKASVPLERLSELLPRVQSDLGPRVDDYWRQFECVCEDEERLVFLVPDDHWASVGERLDLERREWDAVRRAHEEQLRRIGHRDGRDEEFETALELREVVVVGSERN